jgi:ribosomal-protein-alanine N-acetyltransferase
LSELETPRLLLRPWDEADAEALHAAFGDPETMRFWAFPPRRDLPETVDMIRESRAVDPQIHAAFAITLRDTGEPVGMVNYHERRPIHRRLALGWILVRSWQHRGIMREAVPALLNHCFDRLDTNRIEARIEAENTPSVRLAEWLGFAREGLMRDWMFVGGEPRSPHLHALLLSDWAARGQVSSTSNP